MTNAYRLYGKRDVDIKTCKKCKEEYVYPKEVKKGKFTYIYCPYCNYQIGIEKEE